MRSRLAGAAVRPAPLWGRLPERREVRGPGPLQLPAWLLRPELQNSPANKPTDSGRADPDSAARLPRPLQERRPLPKVWPVQV